jgi:Bacterial regulatory proteins, luxR family
MHYCSTLFVFETAPMRQNADLEAKIVDAIYRGACDPGELLRAIELICDLFHSPAAALGEIDQLRPECQLLLRSGSMRGAQELIRYGQYAHLDPLPRALAALAAGTVTTSNRVVPQSKERSVFVNEFLVPLGATETLGCTLSSSKGRLAVLSVLQGVKRNSYDDHDIARLERFTPHLTRALQIRRLFLQSEARGKALESIVDRNETGMVGLRHNGPALFVNSAARAVAAAHDGIGLNRHGRLVTADRLAATRLAKLEADVLRGGAGGLVRIPRPSGGPPYVVLVSALPSGDDPLPQSQGGVLFAIHDPTRRKTPTERRIAELLHIPLGAAKLVQAMLEGADLKDYADRAGISMNTVRFHLKTAFARTETRSQAELVRIALSALKDLGPYFSPEK